MRSARLRSIILTLAALYFSLIGGADFTTVLFLPRVIHQTILVVILGIWLTSLIRSRRPFPRTPLDVPILIVFCFYIIATIFALDPRMAREGLWTLFVHTLFFYVAVDLMRRYRPETVVKPMLFASAVVIVVSLVQIVSWYFGLAPFEVGWWQIGGLADPIPPYFYRLFVFSLGPTALAGYIGVWIPVALAWLVATRHTETRRMLVLWLAASLIVAFFTLSRGILLSLLVSLSSFAAIYLVGSSRWASRIQQSLRRPLIRAGGVIVGLLGAAAIIFVVLSAGNLRRQVVGDTVTASDNIRLELWRSALSIVRSDPLTGVGPENVGRALRLYSDPDIIEPQLSNVDNFPLLVMVETGLTGLVGLILIAVVMLLVAIKRWLNSDGAERIRVAGAAAMLLGYTAHNVVDAFRSLPNLLPVFVMAAYLVVPLSSSDPRQLLPWDRESAAPDSGHAGGLPVILLGVLMLAVVLWVPADIAHYFSTRADKLAAAGDRQTALADLDRARRLDPGMGLIAAQRADLLGGVAGSDPQAINRALDAYQAAFAFEDSNDIMHANAAMLYLRIDDPQAALAEMLAAAEVYPPDPVNGFWAGMLAESLGDDELAHDLYFDALDRVSYWAVSEYWLHSDLARQTRDEYLASRNLSDADLAYLRQLSPACWSTLAGDSPVDPDQTLCSIAFAWVVDSDPDVTLAQLDQIHQSARSEPYFYYLRGEAHLALGDLDSASQDLAVLGVLYDNRIYALLQGKIAEANGDLDLAERAYLQAGAAAQGRTGWSLGIYRRSRAFLRLPDLTAPPIEMTQRRALDALLDLYAAQGRDDDICAIAQSVMLDGTSCPPVP